MLGAIFGDIVGSHYEFDPTKIYDFQLLHEDSRPTDDTVMTLAVAKALMDTYGKDDDTIRRAVVKEMQRLGRKYHNAGYGGTFYHWLDNPDPKPYNSFGNGSGMRVSSVGWLYPSLGHTLNMAKLTADVTHNHPEGIKGAQAIAAGMYLARTGHDKDFIKEYLANTFRYDLDRTLDDIRPTYEFDVTCQGSVPEAIIAFLESDSYEGAIRKAVSLGGDADTQGCMAGALAEAFYGDVPQPFRQEALERLPKDLREIAERFEEFRKDLCKASGVHWIDGGHELIDPIPPKDYKPWEDDMTLDDALEILEEYSNGNMSYNLVTEYPNCFIFGWKEPRLQNPPIIFKNNYTNVYHSMLELPQDIDLEHPVRTIDLTEYLK